LAYALAAKTGLRYNFRHKSVNFNGESEYSDVLEVFACENPSPPGRPTWVTSTVSAIILAWERSADDGGCNILEYRLYRDAGDGSGLVTIEVHDEELRGNPQAAGQVVTELPAGGLGSEFVFQLRVFTEYTLLVDGDGVRGEASVPILYAGVPGAPANPPRRGILSSATVLHAEVEAVTTTNGAAITSYELQVDDGLGGPFEELKGATAPSLSL